MRAVSLAACLALAGCATAAGLTPTAPEPPEVTSRAVALRNADFELPPRPDRCATGWSCVTHSDPASFRFLVVPEPGAQGRQALCIERVRPEPWAVASQGVHDASLSGALLSMSVRVKAEGLDGNGVGPWAVVQDGSGRQIAWGNRLVKSTRGWETITYDFDVPAGAAIVEVGVTLEGAGRVCVDDIKAWRRSGP